VGGVGFPERVELGFGALEFAMRNPEMPLEAMRFDITPSEMHYLLAHFEIPFVDPGEWRLSIGGHVARPLSLTLGHLRRLPTVSLAVTLECAGNGRALLTPQTDAWQPWVYGGVSTAEWKGTSLQPILEEAGILHGAVEVLFTGIDEGIEEGITQHYERSLPIDEALRPDVLLSYEMNGQPLPRRHGFPLRLIVPGWYGMAHVKWLRRITVLTEPYGGYMQTSYRIQQREDDPGTPVTRIAPRSLMVRPGMLNDEGVRVMHSRRFKLRGRAWSGWAEVERVAISVDGGHTWRDAALESPRSPYGWIGWAIGCELPDEGEYELRSRATDALGNTQPDDQLWNLGGFANNVVERVRAVVLPA
jgi:sulfane dehydrogenase subunit SoxC